MENSANSACNDEETDPVGLAYNHYKASSAGTRHGADNYDGLLFKTYRVNNAAEANKLHNYICFAPDKFIERNFPEIGLNPKKPPNCHFRETTGGDDYYECNSYSSNVIK